MESVLSLLKDVSSTGLGVIIQILVVVIGVILIAAIKKLFDKLNLEVDQKQMDSIKSVIEDVVRTTNQKIVDIIKEKNPNNKLTEEQQEYIFNTVKDTVMASLSAKEIKVITDKFGDIETGIECMIESCVSVNGSLGCITSYGTELLTLEDKKDESITEPKTDNNVSEDVPTEEQAIHEITSGEAEDVKAE